MPPLIARPTSKALAVLAAVVSMSLPAVVLAAAADPAAQRIDTFDQNLLAVMKQGKALGFAGRTARLRPAIEATLNLPVMTRYAVGPAWASMTEAQHAALVAAFSRMTVATYAHNFDSYDGETFTVDPNVVVRGPDKLVKTVLKPGHGAPVTLSYRMQEAGGGWKVIDVYYQGAVSELTTRRADFAATVAKGGAPSLIAHIDALTDKLSK